MAMLLEICPAVFIMLTGKLNPDAVPPVSSSDHSEKTLWLCNMPNAVGLLINPVVQFGLQLKPVPASAVSKKGCGARPASVLAGVAAWQAPIQVAQPIAFSMLA